MFGYLRLAFFTQHNTLEILQVVSVIRSSSLLSSVLWAEFTYLFTLEERLGCFQFWAVTNKAAVTTHAQVVVF